MGASRRASPPPESPEQQAGSAAATAQWRQAKAVFIAALDRRDDQRQAFLDEACAGDPALYAEVRSLLANERDAGSFAETPAATLLNERAGHPDGGNHLSPGARLGAYEVIGFIAAGGMGEVYRARHTTLGRAVALKIVNPQLADAAAKRRLVREARHASVLSHPNICTIYDVGEDGDPTPMPYVAMQLVEGASLHERIARGVPPLDDALDIGEQVASALEHAHQHGIIHRDLKSANVVVDAAGHAIVLDFGLAKRLPCAIGERSERSESTVTAGGALAGTLSHMAPEVLRGEEADVRSDIWALGVLLYELVSGRLPFAGRTPFETSSAILGEPPPPLRRQAPVALRLVIERCLAKPPHRRYQHAAEVRAAIVRIRRQRAWPVVGGVALMVHPRAAARVAVIAVLLLAAGTAAHRWRAALGGALGLRASTVAVMPLEASGDTLAAYYAAGMTEAIVGRLGALTNGRVLAASATAGVTRTAASRAALATRLHADVLVEGRVRKSVDRVAIDVRLLDARGGRVIWSDRFDRDRRQAAALEDDVARAIAREVRARLPAGIVPAPRAVNPEAYEEYLKGRYEWNRRTVASLRGAVVHFQAAVDADPTYAPAHAALADCYNQFATQMVGVASPREYRPRAAAEAIAALQIDPYSAEAHAALGYVKHYEWQWSDAEREFRRAIELNPSYALAHLWYANLLMSRRRFGESLAQAQLARDLDPFSLIVRANIGWILTAAGRPRDAIDVLGEALRLDSAYVQAHARIIDPLVMTGRLDEAARQEMFVAAHSNGSAVSLGGRAGMNALAGHAAAARAQLDTMLRRGRTEYVPPGAVALVYAELHDTAGQDAWLARAFDEHSNAIAYLASDERLWIHDEFYRALLGKAGLR